MRAWRPVRALPSALLRSRTCVRSLRVLDGAFALTVRATDVGGSLECRTLKLEEYPNRG